MSKLIPLSRGLFATVDDDDFNWLNQWKWSAMKVTRAGTTRFYAVRVEQRDGKQKMLLMHRVITGAAKGVVIDHKNRDSLDNQRDNLRGCTQAQNSLNRVANQTGTKTSRFKGVYRDRHYWRARFKSRFLGSFATEEAAAAAYDKAALAHDADFALVNAVGGV